MSDEIKKMLHETNKLVNENRASYETALEQNKADSAELKEKQEKMLNDFTAVTKKMEELEKNNKELQENIAVLEAYKNANPTDQAKKEEKQKALNAVSSMMRNGQNGESFIRTAKELNLISTDSDPDGGFAVITQLEGMKVARFFETSNVRPHADIRRTASDSIKITIDEDEGAASRTAQRSAASSSDTPELKEIKIDVNKYDSEPTVTHEALQDMYFDAESWLNRKAFDKIARTQNTDFVSGSGVGRARGFLTYDAWTTEGTYEYNKIEQLAGGTSANFTADELIKLIGKLKTQYMNSKTIMVMNRATMFNYLMLKKNGFGDYLFMDSVKDALMTMRVLGIPVKLWDDMPDVGSSALPIAVGDFSQSYTIVDKPGIMMIRDMYTDKSRLKLYTAVRTGGAITNFEGIKILACGA